MAKAADDNTPTPDAALLLLCNDYFLLNERMLLLAGNRVLSDFSLVALTDAIMRLRALCDEIREHPPKTPEGWRARFRVCLVCMGDAQSDDVDAAFVRATICEFVWPSGAQS
jgi:hypothetical protein